MAICMSASAHIRAFCSFVNFGMTATSVELLAKSHCHRLVERTVRHVAGVSRRDIYFSQRAILPVRSDKLRAILRA
jgi:hypothetical protein